MIVDHGHGVPRHPQRFDRQLWVEHGFDSAEDSDLWSDRACGVACVSMILEYVTGRPVSTTDLLHEGRGIRAYSERGWIHRGLADLLVRHGVPAEARAVDSLEELGRLVVAEGPAIASVTLHFPESGSTRGGHLVLVTGVDWQSATVTDVHFNDPSRWGADNNRVSAARFAASFTGRVVTTRTTTSRTGDEPVA